MRVLAILATPPCPLIRDVAFIGVMDDPANIDAVERCVRERWRHVRADPADSRFRIVGRSPSARVLALAAQGAAA